MIPLRFAVLLLLLLHVRFHRTTQPRCLRFAFLFFIFYFSEGAHTRACAHARDIGYMETAGMNVEARDPGPDVALERQQRQLAASGFARAKEAVLQTLRKAIAVIARSQWDAEAAHQTVRNIEHAVSVIDEGAPPPQEWLQRLAYGEAAVHRCWACGEPVSLVSGDEDGRRGAVAGELGAVAMSPAIADALRTLDSACARPASQLPSPEEVRHILAIALSLESALIDAINRGTLDPPIWSPLERQDAAQKRECQACHR